MAGGHRVNFKAQLGRLIRWNTADPHAASTKSELPYYIDEDWTPSEAQIAEARKRYQDWCSKRAMQWRRIVDTAELELVRDAVLCASTDRNAVRRRGESLRVLRILALLPDAEFYEREIEHMAPLRLVEFRHPLLKVPNGLAPIGFRFFRLVPQYWRHRNFVGLYLDGHREPIDDAFGDQFRRGEYPDNLVEQFVRFSFDHQMFGDRQYYVVQSADDFVSPDSARIADGQLDRFLTAQFRLGWRRGAEKLPEGEANDPSLTAATVPFPSLLIPPTVLENTKKVARVFATVIAERNLYHVGMSVHWDGKIVVEQYVQRTEGGEALSLIPVRSFNEQRAALKSAFDVLPEPKAV